MTDGFTRRKAQSKKDIREAAWTLFSHYGVERVSVVEIAQKAGVSPATIYNHFDGKDALVREFIAATIDQLVRRFETVLASGKPFWEKMADLIDMVSVQMAQGPSSDSITHFFNGSEALFRDPEIRKIQTMAQEKMIQMLLRLVHEGQASGEIQTSYSEDTYRVYFNAFIKIFPTPEFRACYLKNPQIISELGQMMIWGMRGAGGVFDA